MRIILEEENEKIYAEIFLTEKEIERIKKGCILVSEGKRRYTRRVIGIGIRREDATQERQESESYK